MFFLKQKYRIGNSKMAKEPEEVCILMQMDEGKMVTLRIINLLREQNQKCKLYYISSHFYLAIMQAESCRLLLR